MFAKTGALCLPPFCKHTFGVITFELKHIGTMMVVSRAMFLRSRNQMAPFILMVSLSFHPSAFPSVCLSVHQSVCPSISLSVRPSVCLSVHLSVGPSISQSVLSISVFSWSGCLSVCLSICLSIDLEEIIDGRVVTAGISVTWDVLS